MHSIELTEQQRQAMAASGASPLTLVDPKTNVPYVLLRKDVYEQLKNADYDDSPWTDEEMSLLAEEAGHLLDKYKKEP